MWLRMSKYLMPKTSVNRKDLVEAYYIKPCVAKKRNLLMTEVFAISECFCNYPFLDDGGRGTADDSPGFVLRLSVQYKFGSGPNLDLGVNIQPKFHFVDQQTNDRVRYHRGILEHLSYLTGQSTGGTWTRPHERW